jgi:DeoR/GlpR family transcriptional regulator of sugar metabolism
MEERRNEILKELDRKGRVKVTDLSKEFGCSEVTIRNDIKAMDIEGLLKRTHGGAVKVEKETERKYSAETIYRNVTQKKQIAVVTNSLIAGNELAGVGHVELSIATPQMEVKKAIMKAAEKVYVLADSSKFGGGYLSVICPTNEVDKIITDDGVSKEDIQKAKELDIPLVIA